MPGKSRHGRARQSLSKKRREWQRPAAAQQAPSQAAQPATDNITRPVPRTSVPRSPAAPVLPQYPYVRGELLRICMVAGLILVILFVLSMVLVRP